MSLDPPSLSSTLGRREELLLCLLSITILLAPSGVLAADPPAPMPVPKHFHRAVAFDGKIFVFGGGTGRRFPVLDVESQRWSERESPFTQRPALVTAVAGETLYVLDPFTPALRSYDPEKDEWNTLARPPRKRANTSLAAFKGRLYLVGSYLGVAAEHSVEIYDPKSNSWSTGPPLPGIEKEDHFHLTAVLGDRLHVVGHYFGGKSHWVFDGKTWESRADAPVACGWKSDGLEAVRDGLLLFKPAAPTPGENAERPDEIFHYDAKKDRWRSLGSLPKGYPVIFGATARLNDQVYVLGGHPDPTAVFRYDVTSRAWERSGDGKPES